MKKAHELSFASIASAIDRAASSERFINEFAVASVIERLLRRLSNEKLHHAVAYLFLSRAVSRASKMRCWEETRCMASFQDMQWCEPCLDLERLQAEQGLHVVQAVEYAFLSHEISYRLHAIVYVFNWHRQNDHVEELPMLECAFMGKKQTAHMQTAQ